MSNKRNRGGPKGAFWLVAIGMLLVCALAVVPAMALILGAGENLIVPSGNVGIGTTSPADQAHLFNSASNRLFIESTNAAGYAGVRARTPNREYFYGINTGSDRWVVHDNTAATERLAVASNGHVGIGNNRPTQTLDVLGTGITFRHTDGGERAFLDTAGGGQVGAVATLGPNGNLNAVLINTAGAVNNGAMAVFDAAQNARALMLVDFDGRGFVVADVKSFRVPNSQKPGTDIVYACVEGPEAAAYARGTARLVNGEAVITFPDHFIVVAGPKDITVQLTPLSASSLGLGVSAKDLKGLVVKELHGGKGSYEFDWEVKAVRKGYENYQVIRSQKELTVDTVDKRP